MQILSCLRHLPWPPLRHSVSPMRHSFLPSLLTAFYRAACANSATSHWPLYPSCPLQPCCCSGACHCLSVLFLLRPPISLLSSRRPPRLTPVPSPPCSAIGASPTGPRSTLALPSRICWGALSPHPLPLLLPHPLHWDILGCPLPHGLLLPHPWVPWGEGTPA